MENIAGETVIGSAATIAVEGTGHAYVAVAGAVGSAGPGRLTGGSCEVVIGGAFRTIAVLDALQTYTRAGVGRREGPVVVSLEGNAPGTVQLPVVLAGVATQTVLPVASVAIVGTDQTQRMGGVVVFSCRTFARFFIGRY